MIHHVKAITRALALALTLVVTTAQADPALIDKGPSFSCANPAPIEKIICQDPELSRLDRDAGHLYQVLTSNANEHAKASYRKEQRERIKLRNECTTPPSYAKDTRECIKITYGWDLTTLSQEALMLDPQASLEALKEFLPEAEPLFEAIEVFASVEPSDSRSARLLPLITALYEQITPYASAAFDTYNWPSPKAVLISDKSFADFIGVASALVETRETSNLTLACQAILNRPILKTASEEKFGGAIDGHIIQDNCNQVMPLIPTFDKLALRVEKAVPDCSGGTIRFSLAREYGHLVLLLRLHALEGLSTEAHHNRAPSSFRVENASLIERSIKELTEYYHNTFNVALDKAAEDAKLAVNALIDGSFDIYEGCGVG